MANLATYIPNILAHTSESIINNYQDEIERLKKELVEANRTIREQNQIIREQNKKVIKILEADRIVFNKEKVSFIQAFNMKCTEKSILSHLETFLKAPPTWDNLTTEALQQFSVWLRNSAISKRGKLLNDSTACTYITQLKQVIKYGYTNSQDSSKALKSTRPMNKKKVWLRSADLRKLLGYTSLDQKEMDVRNAFLICSIVGCRISDFQNLLPENIDVDTFRYTPIKTKNKECFVQLSPEAKVVLTELLENKCNSIQSSDGAVLKSIFRKLGLTRKTEIGTPNKIEVVELCDAITFHTARRSFATNKYRYSNWTERQIADAMGHSSFNQTFENYIIDKSAVSDSERIKNGDSIFC